MNIYVLVSNDEGEPTTNMPVHFGRGIRAYNSKARARVYARRFGCAVIELKLQDGKIVYNNDTQILPNK